MADARSAKNEIFISKLFQLTQQKPTDILLYCKDGELRTHKIILSSASLFFEVRLFKFLIFQVIKLSLFHLKDFFNENYVQCIMMPDIRIDDVNILLTFITSGVLYDEDLKRPSFLKTVELLKIPVPLSASPTQTVEIDEGVKPRTKRNVYFGEEVDLEEWRRIRKTRGMSLDQGVEKGLAKGRPSILPQVKRRKEEDSPETSETTCETTRVKQEKLDAEYRKVLHQNGCRFCSRKFVTLMAKEGHQDECKQNPDKPLIICTICNKGGPYTRKIFLQKHMINKHPNSYIEVV